MRPEQEKAGKLILVGGVIFFALYLSSMTSYEGAILEKENGLIERCENFPNGRWGRKFPDQAIIRLSETRWVEVSIDECLPNKKVNLYKRRGIFDPVNISV